jgi:hypothetical protein
MTFVEVKATKALDDRADTNEPLANRDTAA